MTDVKRIYPESKSALINWIEENFHDIDSFVVTFHMKDKTTMTVYEIESYFEALALVEITRDIIHTLSHEDALVTKGGE